MRIFVQYSVSGFKIFDTSRFSHHVNGGCYCTMKEISDTNKGGKNGTHIINTNLHGIDQSIVQLFSSPLVEMLLQSITFDGQEQTMLYVNNAGTSVNQNRDCNIVVLLISEQESEKNLLEAMTLLLLSDNRNPLLSLLGSLIDKRIIGEELVLYYNKDKWQAVINSVIENASRSYQAEKESLGQVLLPTQGIETHRLLQVHSDTFNRKPYRVLKKIQNPYEARLQKLSASSISHAQNSGSTHRLKRLFKVIVKDIKNEMNNNYD